MHATAYPAEGWIISLDAKAQRLERNMNRHSGESIKAFKKRRLELDNEIAKIRGLHKRQRDYFYSNRSETADKGSVIRFLNECTVCDRKCKSKTDLDEHMKKHTNQRWVMKKVMRIHSWIVRQGEMKKNGYQTDDILLIGWNHLRDRYSICDL